MKAIRWVTIVARAGADDLMDQLCQWATQVCASSMLLLLLLLLC